MYNNTSGMFTNGSMGVMTTDRWGWYIRITVTHLIVVIGVVANCLTFILMKSPRLRFKSYSHYLSALAFFDSLVLAFQEIHVVDEILEKRFEQPGVFHGFSDVGCKVFQYTQTVCNLMSSWLIVAMAIERMCVVYMPFRRNIWCQQRGAIIIILSLFGVTASTQVFRLVMVHSDNGCVSKDTHAPTYTVLHIYIYQFTLLFILPVFIVLFCNIGVLVRIFNVEKATQNDDSSSTRLTGSSRRRSKTTRLMVAISFTYILTSLPLVVLTITIHTIAKTMMPSREAGVHLLRSLPWFQFLQTVANLNYASNFFIYILSGKKFRIELRRIFKHDRHNSSIFGGSSRTRDEIIMM